MFLPGKIMFLTYTSLHRCVCAHCAVILEWYVFLKKTHTKKTATVYLLFHNVDMLHTNIIF
jgi:hypothetical protein